MKNQVPIPQNFKKSKLTKGDYLIMVIALALILVTVSLFPWFLTFNARAKQSEAKKSLSAIYSAYQSYHSDHQTYPSSSLIQFGDTVLNCLTIAGWRTSGPTRYNYNCMNTEAFSPVQNDFYCPPGIISTATKDSFTVAACGNVDADTTTDVWTIDDAKHLRNVIDDVKK